MGNSIYTETSETLYAFSSAAEAVDDLELVLSSFRHQLGNTVNSMRIALGVLNENFSAYDDETKKAHLNQINQVVDKQQTIISALKAYSLCNVTELSTLSFPELWALFTDAAKERLDTYKITLANHCMPPVCRIKANGTALNKVMSVVLDNAVDAVINLPDPEVRLAAEKDTRGDAIIRISDNGHGIRKNDLSKIFNPFFTTKQGKTGMGLAICRKLLKQMAGDITIDSDMEKGTEVTIMLKTMKR